MFLSELTSSDPRFRSLAFRDGLNILVADRTDASAQGDSRNSVGKTSFVRILRYLLGGDRPDSFRAPGLSDHVFSAVLHLPGQVPGQDDAVRVSRSVTGTTRLEVVGWSGLTGSGNLHVDQWREALETQIFHMPGDVIRPTVGQLWGQLIRTYFDNPVKGHPAESDWESGTKLGFMLGLSPEVLAPAGDLRRLEAQNKALRKAVKEGALAHLSLDEAGLRASLASARRIRDRLEQSLLAFKVDDQYASHQVSADALSAEIRRINDELLSKQQRVREIRTALVSERPPAEEELQDRLRQMYAEVGVVLPDAVRRRYDEVTAFHSSVIRNRHVFLQDELDALLERLEVLSAERTELDDRRASILGLLRETVALDTFLAAQRDLATQQASVADLERRLESASSLSSIGDTIKLRTAELVSSVRSEVQANNAVLEKSIALFGELGSEIYTDRQASLLVAPTANGTLRVDPHVSGDAGGGVRSVETFMLDMVCTIAALGVDRAPRILVHDSHLFDAIDGRQVASCLNIGARLAEEHGFQYIVTMNSDFLATVRDQSDGAFEPEPYELETRLTDSDAAGGIFGFTFD